MSLKTLSLAPFLYPSKALRVDLRLVKWLAKPSIRSLHCTARRLTLASGEPNETDRDRLNPSPEDYGRQIFTDKCRLTLHTGSGGNGCVSFLREKFVEEGPANGGDGGSGGNIFIQAVRGETSLHKLARQGTFRAGQGRNGQGKSKGGHRGDDVLLQVPVGTVVREISRLDPVALEEKERAMRRANKSEDQEPERVSRKWVMYPEVSLRDFEEGKLPRLPRPRRSHLTALQPAAPIKLDLSEPMDEPQLLAAGATGGLGNPHFITKDMPRPKCATRGNHGMRLEIELELKLLADLGFVGFPNAGKSTLLRALSRSRARVGNWEFTTLQPNIGTVVLDDHNGPAKLQAFDADGRRLTQFSIADIPGIVVDAHKDRGLGLDFLRHIERAQVLAFVVDLSNGNPIEVLKVLWRELDQFEKLKVAPKDTTEPKIESWETFGSTVSSDEVIEGSEDNAFPISNSGASQENHDLISSLPAISTRPWFVVATKADLEGTQANYRLLEAFLKAVSEEKEEHPAGPGARWQGPLKVIPISALKGHGVDAIPRHTVSLLGRTA